jgi:hypothetical protein
MVYRIDKHDRLVGFDYAFRAFATATGAPGLPEQWLGRAIWESSDRSEINMVFRALVARARGGRHVAVPTRCDTPHLMRRIEMTIEGGDDGEVTLTSQVTAARFKHDAPDPVAYTQELLRMCAWCFQIETDGWHGAEHVVAERGLLLGDVPPDITHGICPTCVAERLDELATA